MCGVAGCDAKVFVRGVCRSHYHRLLRHGDPLKGRPSHGAPLAWLKSHVDHDGDECLAWPFSTIRGYGSLYYEKRTQTASRVMCLLAHGEPPMARMDAAHSCGNGHLGCVNPRHLRWATRRENVIEMYDHARARVPA